MSILKTIAAGLAVAIACASTDAFALCADVNDDSQISAADALTVLKKAVGQNVPLNCSCQACGSANTSAGALAHCADVSGDGNVTAADALTVLKKAVGQQVALACSCAACESGTTTTTLSDCPPPGGLDGRTFIEIYTCEESSYGGVPYCIDLNASDSIHFTHLGSGAYEVRDVPDSGYVSNGSLNCTTFTWNASSPGDYTESGTWTFTNDLSSFSGSSQYDAVDNSYSGSCNTTGAKSPDTPPNPPPPPACQQGPTR